MKRSNKSRRKRSKTKRSRSSPRRRYGSSSPFEWKDPSETLRKEMTRVSLGMPPQSRQMPQPQPAQSSQMPQPPQSRQIPQPQPAQSSQMPQPPPQSWRMPLQSWQMPLQSWQMPPQSWQMPPQSWQMPPQSRQMPPQSRQMPQPQPAHQLLQPPLKVESLKKKFFNHRPLELLGKIVISPGNQNEYHLRRVLLALEMHPSLIPDFDYAFGFSNREKNYPTTNQDRTITFKHSVINDRRDGIIFIGKKYDHNGLMSYDRETTAKMIAAVKAL